MSIFIVRQYIVIKLMILVAAFCRITLQCGAGTLKWLDRSP